LQRQTSPGAKTQASGGGGVLMKKGLGGGSAKDDAPKALKKRVVAKEIVKKIGHQLDQQEERGVGKEE